LPGPDACTVEGTDQSFERDYLGAHAFLYAYKDNKATFNAYRREVERLLHWSWQISKKSIFDLRRAEIEAYIKFCQKPPKKWIGVSKPARFTIQDDVLFSQWLRLSVFYGVSESDWQKMDHYFVEILTAVRDYIPTIIRR